MPFGVKWKIFFSAKASARLGGCKSRGFAERVGRPRGRRGGTERKEEKGGPAAGVEGVYSFVGRVAGYRREGELRNAMSGLVQPAGDASIDLGSDLTPFLRPDHLFRLSSSLVAKPPLPVPGGRRDRGRKRQRESAGRQGVDVRDGGEVDTRWAAEGTAESGGGGPRSPACPSYPLGYARSLSPPPPPPSLTLDMLQWYSFTHLLTLAETSLKIFLNKVE